MSDDGFYDEFLEHPDDPTPPYGIPVQRPVSASQAGPAEPLPPPPPPPPPPAPVAMSSSVGDVRGVFDQGPGRHAHGNPAVPGQINAADVIRSHRPVPEMGWRGRVAKVSGINLGVSRTEDEWKKLLARVQRPLRGTYTVAMLGIKGGPGKTTSTLLVGSALGLHREDRCAAIDANPDDGNLADRVGVQTQRSFRDLLADPGIHRFEDVRAYMGSNQRGLWVLRGDDSELSDAEMSATDFKSALARVQIGFPVTLVDCGTGVRHEVMSAVLEAADAVVVVSTARLDAAKLAVKTLRWLHNHGYAHLVRTATVIINEVKGRPGTREVDNLINTFSQSVHAVHVLPYDDHLAEAAVVDFDRLAARTQRVAIEVAASVTDGFASAADKDHAHGWGPR